MVLYRYNMGIFSEFAYLRKLLFVHRLQLPLRFCYNLSGRIVCYFLNRISILHLKFVLTVLLILGRRKGPLGLHNPWLKPYLDIHQVEGRIQFSLLFCSTKIRGCCVECTSLLLNPYLFGWVQNIYTANLRYHYDRTRGPPSLHMQALE